MLAALLELDTRLTRRPSSIEARKAWVNTGRQTRLPLSVLFYNWGYPSMGEAALDALVTALVLWACAVLPALVAESVGDLVTSGPFISYNGFLVATFSSCPVVFRSLFGLYCAFDSLSE